MKYHKDCGIYKKILFGYLITLFKYKKKLVELDMPYGLAIAVNKGPGNKASYRSRSIKVIFVINWISYQYCLSFCKLKPKLVLVGGIKNS